MVNDVWVLAELLTHDTGRQGGEGSKASSGSSEKKLQ